MSQLSSKHDITRAHRIAIGFPDLYDSWQSLPAYFDQHSLTIANHPVMADWERNYMALLADIACRQGGTILEVGFGMGISANYIQSHAVNRHIIIEANQDVFQTLIRFGQHAIRPVVPIQGFWQEVIQNIPSGSIDGILFDTYPLTEDEIHQNHFSFFEEAFRVLRPGGVLTYYSDEIDDFSIVHINRLQQAGFSDIQKEICQVSPPKDCLYWQSNTILAPIIYKSR